MGILLERRPEKEPQCVCNSGRISAAETRDGWSRVAHQKRGTAFCAPPRKPALRTVGTEWGRRSHSRINVSCASAAKLKFVHGDGRRRGGVVRGLSKGPRNVIAWSCRKVCDGEIGR
jgi:hypothetical protein